MSYSEEAAASLRDGRRESGRHGSSGEWMHLPAETSPSRRPAIAPSSCVAVADRSSRHTRAGLLVASASIITSLTQPAFAQAVSAPQPAAGKPAAQGNGEVVVTARRRSEHAQNVPIALSVISGDRLATTGDSTLGQFQQLVPTLQVFGTNQRNTNINIRGLGSNVAFSNDGLEYGVGVYVDNVYYARPGQSQFDLVDLQQVEVLRGPQGTLFGKNTTAGAINITSRPPSFEPEASGEVSGGSFGYHQVRVSASGPISRSLAIRLSVADTHRDGFIRNVVSGQHVQDYDNFSTRGQLLFRPNDDFSVRLIGDYGHQKTACCINLLVKTFDRYDDGTPIANAFDARVASQGYRPLPFDPFARLTDFDAPVSAEMQAYGVSGQVDWRLGQNTVTAIAAQRWWDWDPQNDGDYTAQDIVPATQTRNRQRQFSGELRIASPSDQLVDYVVGAYYFWQVVRGYGVLRFGKDTAGSTLPQLPAALGNLALNGYETRAFTDPMTKSYALFGQSSWKATPSLKLTAGLRYTYETKRGSFTQVQTGGASLAGLAPTTAAIVQGVRNAFSPAAAYSAHFGEGGVSGLVTVSYTPARDVLTYATYSRGTKSGGLNLAVLPAGIDPRVRPETVDSFELGMKSQFFGRKLTANVAAFQTDVRDYQTAVIDIQGVTALQYIDNIPKVRSRGFEADVAWQPVLRLSLTAAAAYTDASYLDYRNALQAPERLNLGPRQDLSGEPLAGVSKFTYSLGADASASLASLGAPAWEGYAHADYAHRSSYFTAASNSRFALVPGYGLLNLRLGVRTADGRWDLSAWARNALDQDYYQLLNAANYGLVTGITGEPRTIGMTLRTKL